MAKSAYAFRPVSPDDEPMLRAWRAEPHVREWWGPPTDDEKPEADPKVSRWIVSCDGTPFAYAQDYAVHGWPEHHFAHLDAGARGIDQYIGPSAMLGRGHGTAFLAQIMARLFAQGAPVLATDPHPDNARAIAVYEKLGFVVAGPVQETQWGLILPMLAHP